MDWSATELTAVSDALSVVRTAAQKRAVDPEQMRLAAEVDFRIQQLRLLQNRIDEATAAHREFMLSRMVDIYQTPTGNIECDDELKANERERIQEYALNIRTDAESFYHVVWQIVLLVRRGFAGIPARKNFGPRGVRNVRNDLLVHPVGRDSDSQRWAWGFGGAPGPILSTPFVDARGNPFTDDGLAANAREFVQELLAHLSDAAP